MKRTNPTQDVLEAVLEAAAREFDNLAEALNYLSETAGDQGLRMLLIQLSDRASVARTDILEVLEGDEVAHEPQVALQND